MFKRLTTILLTTLFLAAMAGCNTIEGAGRDIEKGGKAIKDEAKEQNRR